MEDSFRKSIQEKKKQYRHRKTNSEVESLVMTGNTENTEGDEKDKDQATQPSETNEPEEEGTGYDLIKRQF